MKQRTRLQDDARPRRRRLPQPNFFAEWAVNLLILLFATAMIAQPYVIPTGSMEDSLLIGDHLIVDKLAYSPPGSLSRHLLPYTPVTGGDIICFRYPGDIGQIFVKRAIGVPGDRISIINKQLYINGEPIEEPYKVHKTGYIDPYRDNFPSSPNAFIHEGGRLMLANHVVNGELVVPEGNYFAMGDNRDLSLDSCYWGFVPRANSSAFALPSKSLSCVASTGLFGSKP